MKLPRRQFLHLAAGVAALPAVSRIARAQTYPSRPITLIIPLPAGGSTDLVGRILSERLRASLSQPVIIENVGGAGGDENRSMSAMPRKRRRAVKMLPVAMGHKRTDAARHG